MGITVILAYFGALAFGSAHRLGAQHEVTYLPGLDTDLPSRHFTGYVSVGAKNYSHLFYYLVESEADVVKDPVVLWLTGGPGCSSLDAFIYENGPFTFNSNPRANEEEETELVPNPYAWSKAATMIYVDSPVGSGMSYSTDPAGAPVMDDNSTTANLLDFITQLLTVQFPHLLGNDLYLAGESYAGVYIPLLASKVLDQNKGVHAHRRLKLQGYAIGNGVTDDYFDGQGQPEFAFAMGLIDPLTYTNLNAVCHSCFWNASRDSACWKAKQDAYQDLTWLNAYDILQDCFTDGKPPPSSVSSAPAMSVDPAEVTDSAHKDASFRRRLLQSGSLRSGQQGVKHGQQLDTQSWQQSHRGEDMQLQAGALASGWRGLVGHAVACSDRRVASKYLNRDVVRQALRLPSVAELEWQPCSDTLDYTLGPVALVPTHRALLAAGLRVLVYSGDHDFVVPFTGTRAWVYSMRMEVTQTYRPWTINGQVAGFAVKFKPGLVFATVKGAGHMVPQTSPVAALHLFTRFLSNRL